MLDSFVAWLLLPLGLALGWYFGRRVPDGDQAATAPAAETLGGLTHLGTDDSDQTIAALMRAVEIDSGTIDLHMTLGSLFRKRGEVDRALRIHEALLARTTLTPDQRQLAQLELAQDYLKAGLLDRAEQLFKELAARGTHTVAALEALQTLFEQSRDWKQAIDNNVRLEGATAQPRRRYAAQYHCELADQARMAKQPAEALKYAKRALDEDPECVRASLLLGRLQQDAQDWTAAIKAYQRVAEQDPRFLPEIMQSLWDCYKALGDAESYLHFLRDIGIDYAGAAPVLAQAQLMQETGIDTRQYLAAAFTERPSWALLERLLDVTVLPASEPLAPAVDAMRKAVSQTAKTRPRYKCGNCGFMPGLLFWQCPSCKQWGSVAPIDEPISGKAE